MKNLFKDVRFYLSIIVGATVILGCILGYAELPKKVEDNTANVDKLAKTVDVYIKVQAVRQEAQDKREELMIQMVREEKPKGGALRKLKRLLF